jgi:hypothetical protein
VAVQTEVECPTCRGAGKIVRPSRAFTHSDVAEAIGTQRTSIAHFLGGRQTFTMDATLRLIDWLAAQENAPTQTITHTVIIGEPE